MLDSFRTLLRQTFLAASFTVIISSAAFSQTACSTKPVKIQVSAGQLDAAISQLSSQINCEIVYDKDLAQRFKSNAVSGNLAPWEALIMLVKGTGLEVHADKNKLDINQTDQQDIKIKASKLQEDVNEAVRSKKITQKVANHIYAELGEVKISAGELAKNQGFVSAGEKASYERTFKETRKLLSSGN